MLTLKDFTYQLPRELIAHEPETVRDHCRLLVFNRQNGHWSHHRFDELPSLLSGLEEEIVLVRNNSKVIPARLQAKKASGGQVEVFLVRQLDSQAQTQTWQCLTKPGLKVGQSLIFPNSAITAKCAEITEYSRRLIFQATPTAFNHFVDTYGHTPIPPYIHTHLPEAQLREVYQTTYAQTSGSVAAPTAGLHFTPQLMNTLEKCGFSFIDVTLHVSLGTFLGVKTNNLTEHHMHTESYSIDVPNMRKLAHALTTNQKILAIGTTATRTLESLYSRIICGNKPCPNIDQSPTHDLNYYRKLCGEKLAQFPQPFVAETDIFLYPPVRFHLTDHLITNFHLTESTLLMLVAAFTSQPNCNLTFTNWLSSPLGTAYQDAIAHKYRFFSFGDAMLIL